VKAQHCCGVAGGYVGSHAVSAKQFLAALTLPHKGSSHDSTTDSAFVLHGNTLGKNGSHKIIGVLEILILTFKHYFQMLGQVWVTAVLESIVTASWLCNTTQVAKN
jgi:hypothetical protein